MISEEIQRMGGREQATVFNDDLEQAIRENGRRWESNKDYVDHQVEQARKNPGLFYFGISDAGKRIAWIPPVGSPSTTPIPRLTIPPQCWNPIGSKDKYHRLHTQVQINGNMFHAEAYEITTEPDGLVKVLEEGYDALLDEIAPGQCMESMRIGAGPQDPQLADRMYVIIISPHCE